MLHPMLLTPLPFHFIIISKQYNETVKSSNKFQYLRLGASSCSDKGSSSLYKYQAFTKVIKSY